MLGRKKKEAPESTPEQQLEKRVDAMMDPALPDAPAPEKPEDSAPEPGKDNALPPLDIFNDPKTAPDVPKKLLKELGADTGSKALKSEPAPATKYDASAESEADENTPLDDSKTDAAIDEIVAQEGDTVLEAEDSATKPPKEVVKKSSRLDALKSLARHWWFWPVLVLVILVLLAAIPFTRYKLAGLVVKQDVSLVVTDGTTGTTVSDAEVTVAGRSAKTDATGKATLHVPVGPTTLAISKQYYSSYSQKLTVPLTGSHSPVQVRLIATGRQVPVVVVNAITGAALSGAEVNLLGTAAKTDKTGAATIVLLAKNPTASATISLSGYNTARATVQITNKVVPANTFKLIPAGQVYFLSNASGKIDVIKSNLDGSSRQTVLAGTGNEDTNNTVLLASSDWQYLALLSKRDGSQYPKLYLIATASDKLATIDDAPLNFSPIGWSGHNFVYRADNQSANSWQPGATAIKGYAADSAKTNTLVTTTATGTSNADAQYQNVWDTLIMGNYLIYDTTWYSYPGYTTVSGQQNTLAWIHTDGSGNKTLKSVDAGSSYFSNLKMVQPNQADFGVYSNGSSGATFYRLDSSGNVTQSNTITSNTINQNYPLYLTSPSGSQTFWDEIRDGKHTLFVGDQAASNPTQVATASDYAPYAWFTNNYLLVSKNSSELYVMSADGKGQAIKISNYYKPTQNFYGYGGQ